MTNILSSTPPDNRPRSQAFRVHHLDGTSRTIWPIGRDHWALEQLLAAGASGCTPLHNPAPRWSHYVFKLRKVHGLNIETVTESHGGEFAGTHARYVLRDCVEPIEGEGW